MVLAIEPMINAGGPDVVYVLDDQWSIATEDGSLSAHFEHTVAITDDGPRDPDARRVSRSGFATMTVARRSRAALCGLT